MNTTEIVLIVAIVLVLAYVAASYNGLVALRNQTDEAYSDIDVQLKRRYDLVPNLVETVKGYAKHESGLFEAVTEARSKAISAGDKSMKEHQTAENNLTGALRSVFAVAENYPELKASENFKQLSAELSDTENKIEAARRFYNANVRDMNTRIQSFPSNIVANLFKFTSREMFELEDVAAREAVKVSF